MTVFMQKEVLETDQSKYRYLIVSVHLFSLQYVGLQLFGFTVSLELNAIYDTEYIHLIFEWQLASVTSGQALVLISYICHFCFF